MINNRINMKTEDMPKISRHELGEKLDEILEKAIKENTAFLITDEGKKDLVLCPASWYDPFRDSDFGLIVNAAIRYAMGRQTYMPLSVSDFTIGFMPMLDNRTIQVIINDITEELRFRNGEMPQLDIWLHLKEKAEEERKQRQDEGRWS